MPLAIGDEALPTRTTSRPRLSPQTGVAVAANGGFATALAPLLGNRTHESGLICASCARLVMLSRGAEQ